MAKDLLAMAREVVGYEFPSKDALEKYLKDHPKAKKENHWVKEQKPEKNPQKSDGAGTEEKTEDSAKGKFRVPEHKLLKFEMSGDLGNSENWKARIVLGNSMREKQKVGDMDAVGYVAISTVNEEVVPIARADEHQAGYELLHHLSQKGALRSRPQDFITLYPHNNYPHYTTNDTAKYAKAVRKWLDYGGPNACVHSQRQGAKGSSDYVTDMEEYANLGGSVPYGQKGPSKAGREIIEHLEGAAQSLKDGKVMEAVAQAKKLTDRLKTFSSYTINFDEIETGKKELDEAGDDSEKVGKVIKRMATAMRDHLKEERGRTYGSYVKGLFGSGDDSDKRIEKVAGGDIGPEKKEGEKPRLTTTGQDVVDNLERAAKALISDSPTAQAGLHGRVRDLVRLIEPMMEDVEGLGPAIERLVRASEESTDIEDVKQALFANNGVKNLLHQRLRKLEKDGVTKDQHFGDVKSALEEFDRLGQI